MTKADGDISPMEPSIQFQDSSTSSSAEKNRSEWHAFPDRKLEDVDTEAQESPYDAPHSHDFKKKQQYSGLTLLWIAYQSVGVIYGDIGTSPLYVYSSTFSDVPAYEDLVGALSLIIWTLIIMVSIKYVLIVLQADDEGEGGTFALYSLLSRYSNIMQRNPREPPTVKIERYMTKDMKKPNTKFRQFLEQSIVLRNLIKVLSVLGVSFVIAVLRQRLIFVSPDGILTPAQSVLGAIQGLKVAAPGIETKTIVGISCAILVILFFIQPFGTSKLGSTFAPIVILWLTFNFTFGIYNLAKFDASVLKAFSPFFAGHWFVRKKTEGWRELGGILLAFTGVEALFADLGAFSAKAIRLSWLCFAFPCLLLAYIGQAAYISVNPEAYSNPFFNTVPPGMYWPSLVLSILASVVASQAMITGAFQLLSQTMQMSYFPHIKLVHTSNKFHGQIYVPMANWLLLGGTLIVTVVYNNTTSLGNAYGVCVVCVTFITTCLVSVAAIIVWQLNVLIVIAGFLVFGTFDCLYLSSALTKVPSGAWFTLMIGAILASILLLWRYGKNQQWASEAEDIVSPSRLVFIGSNGELRLRTPQGGDKDIRMLKGLGVFFDKAGHLAPSVYTHFLRKFEAQHEVTVFFNLRQIQGPHVPEDERYSVYRIGVPNTFRVVVRHGYADYVLNEDFGSVLTGQLHVFLAKEIESLLPHAEHNIAEAAKLSRARSEMSMLETAYEKQVVYILGKEQLHLRKTRNILRRVFLNIFMWMRENTRGKPAELGVPVDKLVEIGFVKEI